MLQTWKFGSLGRLIVALKLQNPNKYTETRLQHSTQSRKTVVLDEMVEM